MIHQATTQGMAEAIAEAEAPAAPFGLIEGPLGHLTDQLLDEEFYSAAMWGEFFEELHENAPEPAGFSVQQVFDI